MSEKTRYSFKTKEEIASKEEIKTRLTKAPKQEESPKTPTGFIGLFWIDEENKCLFGVKRIPIRLGMTGKDDVYKPDTTIIDFSHEVIWGQHMAECRIPDRIITQYQDQGRRNYIPKGRISYMKHDDSYIVEFHLLENEDEDIINSSFKENIMKSVRSEFSLQFQKVEFHNEIGGICGSVVWKEENSSKFLP